MLKNIERSLQKAIKEDAEKKIILLSGPRQCGKTTLSKSLFKKTDYLNYDNVKDRILLKDQSWSRDCDLVVFDELHKMKNWKSWIKGIYDKEGLNPRLLITGSARLDIKKKMGDSLAGRHFQYRLYPFDLKEVKDVVPPKDALTLFLEVGSFPEPFIEKSEKFYQKWKKGHLDLILRQDLLDLVYIKDISSIELLVELLKSRVGSTISYQSLAEDLQKDASTVKRWLQMLENLLIVFKVIPYSENIARSVLKEPKYYFYDVAQVEAGTAARFENFVALTLLKEIHFQEDVNGIPGALHYLKIKGGKEVDFLVVQNKKPQMMIEVKESDFKPSNQFTVFPKFFKKIEMLQLVHRLDRKYDYPVGVKVRPFAEWAANIDFSRPV
ncbi:MAG: ATP-binding protein [Deltaproteobacteria bacterium]|nr:ATP-binding protein [Deltaproteobacteria bacterium]